MPEIPKNAQRVFQGEMFDIYQWDQELYDGSHATFEMAKRPDTIEIIAVTEDKKILVAKQEQPTKPLSYSLVGGRADEGEKPEETAARELREESGYEADYFELYFENDPVHKLDWTIYYFIAYGCKKVGNAELDAGEKIEILELDVDEFLERSMAEDFWAGDFSEHVLRLYKENRLSELKDRILK